MFVRGMSRAHSHGGPGTAGYDVRYLLIMFKRLTISATNARLQQAYGRGAVARGESDNNISEARERLKTDKYKSPLDI
jgi:hypothetical protein